MTCDIVAETRTISAASPHTLVTLCTSLLLLLPPLPLLPPPPLLLPLMLSHCAYLYNNKNIACARFTVLSNNSASHHMLLLLLLLLELLPNTIWKRQRAAVCVRVLKHDTSGGQELHGSTFKRELLVSHTTMRPSPSNATHAGGMSELPCAAALAADGAHLSPVPVPQHLHTMIVAISYNKVALIIKRNIHGTVELPTACAVFPDVTHAPSCSSPPPALVLLLAPSLGIRGTTSCC